MDLFQLIGFFISVLAIIVLMSKKASDERRRRQDPERFAKEEQEREERLRSFLKDLDVEMKETKSIPPKYEEGRLKPSAPVKFSHAKEKPKETMISKPVPFSIAVHQNAYHPDLSMRPSRGKKIFADISDKKQLIMISEILSKPKWQE